MDRPRLVVVLLAFLLGAGTAVAAYVAYGSIVGMTSSDGDCSLEFAVVTLDTANGTFYRVHALKTEPRSLADYDVTFFTYAEPDPYGNQEKQVRFSGPLPTIVGAVGDFVFEDRGAHDGMLDDGGDYFWARTWHNLEVFRAGTVVGGTLGCA